MGVGITELLDFDLISNNYLVCHSFGPILTGGGAPFRRRIWRMTLQLLFTRGSNGIHREYNVEVFTRKWQKRNAKNKMRTLTYFAPLPEYKSRYHCILGV